MEIETKLTNLKVYISDAIRFVDSKSNHPCLFGILFKARDGELVITSTNLQRSYSAVVMPCDVIEEGSVVIPARTLLDLLNAYTDEDISITTDEKFTSTIICGNHTSKVKGFDAQEFPVIGSNDGVVLSLTTDELKTALQATAFAASADESRPVLSTIHVAVRGGAAMFEAADGFRASRYTLDIGNRMTDNVEALVPCKLVKDTIAILGHTDPDDNGVDIHFIGNNKISFNFSRTTICGSLVEGNYPNINTVLNCDNTVNYIASVKRVDLSAAIKTVDVFSKEAANVVKLTILSGHDKIRLSSRKTESGNGLTEVDAVIKSSNEESDYSIAFNNRFLQEFVSSTKNETITIEVQDSAKPGLLHFGDKSKFRHVIMPMQMRDEEAVQ